MLGVLEGWWCRVTTGDEMVTPRVWPPSKWLKTGGRKRSGRRGLELRAARSQGTGFGMCHSPVERRGLAVQECGSESHGLEPFIKLSDCT